MDKTIRRSRNPKSNKQKPIAIGKASAWENDSLPCGMPAKLLTPLPPLSREFRSMMPQDLKELLSAFNDHGVKHFVVGGYAFGVHAEPRATKDLDLFIRPDCVSFYEAWEIISKADLIRNKLASAREQDLLLDVKKLRAASL